jgi:hypothetical protein
MGKRGTTFGENAEPVSTISTPYERGTRFTVQVGLENLTFDCRRLPEAIRAHSIWKLDRAILRTLPGANFIE